MNRIWNVPIKWFLLLGVLLGVAFVFVMEARADGLPTRDPKPPTAHDVGVLYIDNAALPTRTEGVIEESSWARIKRLFSDLIVGGCTKPLDPSVSVIMIDPARPVR